MQRQRMKAAFRVQAAEEGGCKLLLTLINNSQLLTLAKLYSLANKNPNRGNQKIDDRKLEDIIYYGLKRYIETFKAELAQWEGIPSDLIELCDSTNYPQDFNALSEAQMNATKLFNDWERSQQKETNQ